MNQKNKINILLAIDNKLFREGIKRILELESGFSVFTGDNSIEEATRLVKEYQPDVILIDKFSTSINSVNQIKNLINDYPKTKVALLIDNINDPYIDQALKIGVHGYLLTETDTATLIEAIKIVSNGRFYLHPLLSHNLVTQYRQLINDSTTLIAKSNVEYRKPLHLLTTRECGILQLLAEGKSNRAISDITHISDKTVKNHVSNILQKMKVNDRTHAVVTAIKNGWVDVM